MAQSSSKWIENTVGKGEIARYEQFLLFPQCFQRACTADTQKPGLVWERVNPLPHMPILGSSNSTANIKIRCQKYGPMGIQLSD